jgi:hypothetical protein
LTSVYASGWSPAGEAGGGRLRAALVESTTNALTPCSRELSHERVDGRDLGPELEARDADGVTIGRRALERQADERDLRVVDLLIS